MLRPSAVPTSSCVSLYGRLSDPYAVPPCYYTCTYAYRCEAFPIPRVWGFAARSAYRRGHWSRIASCVP